MPGKLLIIVFFVGIFASAQEPAEVYTSNFNMTSFTYKHNQKWSAYVEVQMRSLEDFMLPDYYEMKGGPMYNINRKNQLMLGVGKYGTYRDSRIYQEETRLWLQYVLSQSLSRVKIDHRVRAEKRFFTFPQTDKQTNDERYRYRLALTIPLTRPKLEPGVLFLNTFEEIFVGPNDNFFKRNRFFGGFGYQVNHFTNANIGYMWQKEYSSVNPDRNYHFVYFGINFTYDRLKDLERGYSVPVAD